MVAYQEQRYSIYDYGDEGFEKLNGLAAKDALQDKAKPMGKELREALEHLLNPTPSPEPDELKDLDESEAQLRQELGYELDGKKALKINTKEKADSAPKMSPRAPTKFWTLALDPDDFRGNQGLTPFLTSIAFRQEFPDRHFEFIYQALKAYHQEGGNYQQRSMLRLAERLGMKGRRLERYLATPQCRQVLSKEHHRALSLKIYQSPSLHFPSGVVAPLRLYEVPKSVAEALRLFEDYRKLIEDYPYLVMGSHHPAHPVSLSRTGRLKLSQTLSAYMPVLLQNLSPLNEPYLLSELFGRLEHEANLSLDDFKRLLLDAQRQGLVKLKRHLGNQQIYAVKMI
ncbi:MAG: hypothetical protein R2880_03305 [Deinococcales bacterium]